MITKLTCCVLLLVSLFRTILPFSDRTEKGNEKNLTVRFYDEQGIRQILDDLTLKEQSGLLPEPEAEKESLAFAGWALEPLQGMEQEEEEEKQTGKQREGFLLSGTITDCAILTDKGTLLDLRPYLKENHLALFSRWKPLIQEIQNSELPEAEENGENGENGENKETQSDPALQDPENLLPEADLAEALPEEAPQPETRIVPTELDEAWTIRFSSEKEEIQDLVFYQNERVAWPEMEDETFLGWKIAPAYQNPDQPVEGGFDPSNHLILANSRLDFHVVEYALPENPNQPAGLSTLTPFFQNHLLELEAVYAPQTEAEEWEEAAEESAAAEEETGSVHPESRQPEALAASQSAYAIFTPSSGALDFYWGIPPASSSSAAVIPFDLYVTTASTWPWLKYASSITTATFHNQYTPFVFSSWFSGCSRLQSVQGTEKLNWSKCNSASGMFAGCSSLKSVDVSSFQTAGVVNFGSMFYGCSSLENVDVSGFDTTSGRVFSSMFMNCASLKSLDVSDFDVHNAQSLGGMFRNCSSLNTLNPSGWNVSDCMDFSGLFAGCSSLQNLDLSEWDTSAATTLFMMFLDCTSLQIQGLENWVTDHVTTMNRTFNGVQNAQLNLNSWNTSANTSLEWCFGNAAAKSIEVSSWDVSHVTTMASMCAGAQSLTEFDVSRWQTSSLTSLEDAFRYASSLPALAVSNWDTSRLTSLYQSFQYCAALQSLDVSKWNLENCTTLYCTFNGCSSLMGLNPSGWNTASVTNMRWTFGSCSAIQTLDVSGWKTDAVHRMDHLFYDMASLESLDLSGPGSWNTKNASDLQAMFLENPKLSAVNLSEDFSFMGQAPQSLWAIFMEAPEDSFGLSDPSILPASLQGAWMCEKTTGDTSLYALPEQLQKDYQGNTMAGLWTWARGGLLEIQVSFTGDNPDLPAVLEAVCLLTEGNAFTLPDGTSPLPSQKTQLSSSENRRNWNTTLFLLNGTDLYVSSLEGIPAGYTLISSSGPITRENALQIIPGAAGKAEFVYQSYLPVALPETGEDDLMKLAIPALGLMALCALILMKQRMRHRSGK